MKSINALLKPSYRYATILFGIFFLMTAHTKAQCPTNIGFEDGTFTGWTCSTGTATSNAGTGLNTISLTNQAGPVAGRHTMLSAVPGDGLDEYGAFPKNCPNGSAHSIKLGNNTVNTPKAEGVSYQFTIPATASQYSLVYYYAVVFQDQGHPAYQQPRLEIEITNVTDGTPITCSNFSFIATSGLPGFFQSTKPGGNTPVWCKDWSANSVNLNGNAGKTIKISFKTANCTPGGHFGYAYIDVSTECSSSFVGANYCHDDTAVTIRAPFGYQGYTWFNSTYTQVLGTTQTLRLAPPPPPGTYLNVELTPFNGYGCKDTQTARLIDTLTIKANAGADRASCQNAAVQLGGPPKEGLVYSWSPTTGLDNPNISNPTASPSATTTYVLSVRNSGGGCLSLDTVVITTSNLDNAITLIGNSNFCTGSGQNPVLRVSPADSIQWYKDGVAIAGAHDTLYSVTQSGNYYATIFSTGGCSIQTATKQIAVYPNPVASFTTNNSNQCFTGNQFVFTSTVPPATLQYTWDLGDGTTASTTNVTHSYALSGTYAVKMIVTGNGGCKDSSTVNVTVMPSIKAGFVLAQDTQCFHNNLFVLTDTSKASSGTIQYHWDMGNGITFSTPNVSYAYPAAGTYNIVLATATPGGCADTARIAVTVNPSAKASFTVNTATQCFNGNQFVFTNASTISSGTAQYEWDLGDGTTFTTKDVSYAYTNAGTYSVKLVARAPGGCNDSSNIAVTIYPTPTASFEMAKVICTDLPVKILNNSVNNTTSTIKYLWDFGNGITSTDQTPVFSYATAGTYTVTLSVSTTQCPTTAHSMQQTIKVEPPTPGVTYPELDAIFNFREQLTARPIGTSAIWTPATNLNNPYSYNPVFVGVTPQLYTVQLKTSFGCVTVDTQMVKTHKKIDIYVPNAFTPDGDGVNDLLRPILMSFSKVNYFRIFNRYGQLLFEMKSELPGWDGRVKGELLSTQTVVWVIEAVDVDGKVHKEQGTTILIR